MWLSKLYLNIDAFYFFFLARALQISNFIFKIKECVSRIILCVWFKTKPFIYTLKKFFNYMRLIVEIFDIDIKIGISMSIFWRLFFWRLDGFFWKIKFLNVLYFILYLFICHVYSVDILDKIFSFIFIESHDKFLHDACIIFHFSLWKIINQNLTKISQIFKPRTHTNSNQRIISPLRHTSLYKPLYNPSESTRAYHA